MFGRETLPACSDFNKEPAVLVVPPKPNELTDEDMRQMFEEWELGSSVSYLLEYTQEKCPYLITDHKQDLRFRRFLLYGSWNGSWELVDGVID